MPHVQRLGAAAAVSRVPYRMAVFDLDGTLLNTAEGILAAITHTARELCLPLPPSEQLAPAFIGPPAESSFATVFGLHGAALTAACRSFRTRYATHELYRAEPYCGIFAVLQALKARGVLLGIATYKKERYALPLLAHFRLTPLLDVACGTLGEEPKAAVLARVLQETGVAPSGAVMIGDTTSDAEAAAAVGCDFIGVTYGFGFRQESEKKATRARFFADVPTDILHFFER